MKDFPSVEVARITGNCVPTDGETFVRWDGGTMEELQKLVEIGACDPEDTQNSSPSIQEILDELSLCPGKVTLFGYVIYPPREDARVSVEGFHAEALTPNEALDLMVKFRDADEVDRSKGQDGLISLRFWWD